MHLAVCDDDCSGLETSQQDRILWGCQIEDMTRHRHVARSEVEVEGLQEEHVSAPHSCCHSLTLFSGWKTTLEVELVQES